MSEVPQHTGALRYDDVRDGPIVLTADQKAEVAKRMEALSKLLDDKRIIAKYKIEVMFGKARRSQGQPTPGMISFWANGTKLHGGGDEKLYLCPGSHLKISNCSAVLLDAYNNGTGVVCPSCGTIWQHEQVIGELLLNLPMRKWADVLYKYFRLFEQHCDIYLKYAPEDIRSRTKEQSERATWDGTKVLARARAKRAKAIYTLHNIIKDVNAGADVLSRFYAFLIA